MEVSGQLHAPDALLRDKSPGTHWIGGWVGPRAGRDALVKRLIPITAPDGNWTPVVQPAYT
jgi:hypothetical protein